MFNFHTCPAYSKFNCPFIPLDEQNCNITDTHDVSMMDKGQGHLLVKAEAVLSTALHQAQYLFTCHSLQHRLYPNDKRTQKYMKIVHSILWGSAH